MMTKLRKIILIPALILVSISGFFSCGVDRWPEYAHHNCTGYMDVRHHATELSVVSRPTFLR